MLVSGRRDISGGGELRWPPSCGSPDLVNRRDTPGRMRVDEDKLEALRQWGEALRASDGEERSAAGRAVLMLIDEVERLRLELRRTREEIDRRTHIEVTEEPSSTPSSMLQQRLHRVLGRDPESLAGTVRESAEHDVVHSESDETSSPQAWIESLRRET